MLTVTADQVRFRVEDQAKAVDVTLAGDGTAVRFGLEHTNITSGTAYVGIGSPPTAWSATGCTFNVTGFVEFSAIHSAQTAFRVVYVHSTFSDSEIGYATAIGGTVPGAALELCRALRFDALKRARWMAADGSQYDDTQALNRIGELENALRKEVEDTVAGDGTIWGWSQEQENYG